MGKITTGQGVKIFISFMLPLFILLNGCAAVRIEEYRQTPTSIGADEAVVILGRTTYNSHLHPHQFGLCNRQSMQDILCLLSQIDHEHPADGTIYLDHLLMLVRFVVQTMDRVDP